MYIKLCGYGLAGAALLTSVAVTVLGGRWQKLEAAAYGGKQRLWGFDLVGILLIGFYALPLALVPGWLTNFA